MRQIGTILSLPLLLASLAAAGNQASRPRTAPATVSVAERNVIKNYHACVMAAARRAPATSARGPDAALAALYACPKARSAAQALLTEKYGFSAKQALFRALDNRILRDAEAVDMRRRTGN